MMWLLSLRAEAERDLAVACDWYGEKRPDLEDEFLEEIGRAMRELERDPTLHPLYYRSFRRVLIRAIPLQVVLSGDRRSDCHLPIAARETGTQSSA
ncbi:MAG TPA: hypothetical protein VGM64_07635 [Lacunisphaera sp.]|jgi:hypothetical protein